VSISRQLAESARTTYDIPTGNASVETMFFCYWLDNQGAPTITEATDGRQIGFPDENSALLQHGAKCNWGPSPNGPLDRPTPLGSQMS
jgi:hypothetical protein